MRSLTRTVQNARGVQKSLVRLRKTLRDGTKQSTRRDYFRNAPVLEIDRQIEELLGKCDPGVVQVLDDVADDEKDPLPIPEYTSFVKERGWRNLFTALSSKFQKEPAPKFCYKMGWLAELVLQEGFGLGTLPVEFLPKRTVYIFPTRMHQR